MALSNLSSKEHSSAYNTSKQRHPRREWIITGVLGVLVIIALAVGLGVGLSLKNKNGGSDSDAGEQSSPTTNSTTNGTTIPPTNGTWWKPSKGTPLPLQRSRQNTRQTLNSLYSSS